MTEKSFQTTNWTPARRFISGSAAVLASIIWTHGLAAVLRNIGPEGAPVASVSLTLSSIVIAIIGAALLPRVRSEIVAAVCGLAAALVVQLIHPGAGIAALAVAPVAFAVTRGARWIGERLPDSVDTVTRFRPVVSLVWVLLIVVAVVQIGRLSTSMTDRRHGFSLTTEHPFWYQHECIGAYLYSAEMSARGEENVYHASHYPGLDADAEPQSELEGVALEDPYQYPPQFLLLPRLALAITGDVPTLRIVWFALQITLFAGVAALLALWIGGAAGQTALWMLPLVLISFPALHNFQFGQFHLPTIVLGVAGMLLIAQKRHIGGGALLAAAILAKIFPAVLLPVLLVRRQFKALAWTAFWGIAITLVALAVLGSAPFVAFFDYHMPRMDSGAAFAFDEAWPELSELVIADNQGVFGLGRKFGLSKASAAAVMKVFGGLVFLVATLAGLRRQSVPRVWRAAMWLSLLGLGSLASPGAWGDYVPVTAVWLLTVIATPLARNRLGILVFAAIMPFQFFLLGTMPIGDWVPIDLMITVSAIGALLMLSLFAAVAATKPSVFAESNPREREIPPSHQEELSEAV